jgi:hypothetical protein
LHSSSGNGYEWAMRPAMLVVLAALLVAAAGAGAQRARVRCDAGTTVFADGRLRIFAVPYRTPPTRSGNRESGHRHYACVGRRGRPVGVGTDGSDAGTFSTSAPAYARGGNRYLGSYRTDDGEGGPSAWIVVIDVRTLRAVAYANVTCCEGVPSFRVTDDGRLLLADGPLTLHGPGTRRERTLSAPGTAASDVALAGATVYWTEHPGTGEPVARSAALDGATGDREADLLEPAFVPRRTRPCGRRRGSEVAASPSVRVFERGAARFACRVRGPAHMAAGAPGDPRPRIVANRWVLLRTGDGLSVLDSRSGSVVTAVEGTPLRHATLLRDGTAAWLEQGGRLLVQRPADDSPTELAAASEQPAALAAGRRTVYWTAGGVARSASPARRR